MGHYLDLEKRIDRLCRRALGDADAATLVPEMEDLLAVGYVEALCGEARSRRLASRLEELVETLDAPDAAAEARRLARERRHVDQTTRELRRQLGEMREHFVRLGGGSSLPSS